MCIKRSLVFCLILLLGSCSSKPTIDELKRQIQTTLDQQKGEFAVAFKDLGTGEELLINEHTLFHAASTMKTPVMIEVYKQAADGKFALNDSLTIKTEFNSIVDSTFSLSPDDDSEHDLYSLAGKKTTISDLVYRMITLSSNLATNILIDHIGATNVTQTMRTLGANDILVLRGVEDGKAFRAGLNNKTTAFDLMVIFEKMALGETVSPQASEEMIKVLSAQEFNTIIPAKLPKDVKVAHKTGWITGLNHDSGIVYLPDGRKYVIVILSHKLENEEQALMGMADVSAAIYSFVTGEAIEATTTNP
jgi:beta-lactamase class A